jgi:hypothetical protein
VACEAVAPSLVPVRPGDRVKTDRRDAMKLARSYRGGELTPVGVPDAEHAALRDLVRARQVAKTDQLRARHRVQKLLLRQGRRWHGKRAWTRAHEAWLSGQRFEQPARQAAFLDYLHEVRHADERVAALERAIRGDRVRTAAWAHQHPPAVWGALRLRQKDLSDEVKSIGWKAQNRLHTRYKRLQARGKPRQQVMTAVARELAGFVWSIGQQVQSERVHRV